MILRVFLHLSGGGSKTFKYGKLLNCAGGPLLRLITKHSRRKYVCQNVFKTFIRIMQKIIQSTTRMTVVRLSILLVFQPVSSLLKLYTFFGFFFFINEIFRDKNKNTENDCLEYIISEYKKKDLNTFIRIFYKTRYSRLPIKKRNEFELLLKIYLCMNITSTLWKYYRISTIWRW